MTTPTRPPFLGELELAVMERLWATGAAEAKDLQRAVGEPRGITLNTVQSTLKRLHDKGLLERRKVSHAYVYEPSCTRDQYHRDVIDDVVATLMDGEPSAMLAAFVDVAERAGRDQLERLERIVAARLEARERGGRG